MVYCADCGRKLWFGVNSKNKNIHFFSCSNYFKDYRGTCKIRHYVRADSLEYIVKMELRRLANFLVYDEDGFVEMLTEKSKADAVQEKKCLEEIIKRSQFRLQKVELYFESIYEKNIDGDVTYEWFLLQSQKYGEERMDLKARIANAQERLFMIENVELSKEKFVFALRRFMEFRELTAPMLRELIERIDVHETEGVGNNRLQRIKIHYKFLGEIEIDDYRL